MKLNLQLMARRTARLTHTHHDFHRRAPMATTLPAGLTAGTYAIDPSHSQATFTVRHAGISKVRGSLAIAEGTLNIGDDVESSNVVAAIDAKSVNTGDAGRDGHLQ